MAAWREDFENGEPGEWVDVTNTGLDAAHDLEFSSEYVHDGNWSAFGFEGVAVKHGGGTAGGWFRFPPQVG